MQRHYESYWGEKRNPIQEKTSIVPDKGAIATVNSDNIFPLHNHLYPTI